MEHKKRILSLKLLIAILILTPLVNAFGVSTPFWGEHQLILSPGESKDVYVELQNMVGDEDMTLKAEITKGSEIAKLIDPSTEYFIPFGQRDRKVNIRVTIPEGIPLETNYNIEVSFKQITTAQGGMMQMAGGVGTTIPVVVKVPPIEGALTGETTREVNGSYSLSMLIGLLLFVLLILGYALWRRRK